MQGAEHAVYTLYNAAALRQMADAVSEAFENARENEREFGGKESGERYSRNKKKVETHGSVSQKKQLMIIQNVSIITVVGRLFTQFFQAKNKLNCSLSLPTKRHWILNI